jgi:magnesium chelatase family protein
VVVVLARVRSCALLGIDAYPVEVEVDVGRGLPSFSTVGLPDAAVRESRERVISAIRNSGFEMPPKRVVVNLAPAGTKKEGAGFDLAVQWGARSHRATPPAIATTFRGWLLGRRLNLCGCSFDGAGGHDPGRGVPGSLLTSDGGFGRQR